MSDEEVNRELKRVQLQREKMQLEKEIAQRQRANQVSQALSTAGSSFLYSLGRIIGRLIGFIRFIGHNFLKIALVTVIVAGGLAGILEFFR